MKSFRIALANVRAGGSPDEAVTIAKRAISEAGEAGAGIVCFPECYVPGYRAPGKEAPPPDEAWLDRAWTEIAGAARTARIAVILGTERVGGRGLMASALVIQPDGTRDGFQDKVQIDPSEEGIYVAGSGRRVFKTGDVNFGVVICHEGWRYPETVRWAVRNGAQIVFHPHFHEAEAGGYRATELLDPKNTFHEKAMLCRAAENTARFASVNCAIPGSSTTSAVVRPDGTVLAYQPYGKEGVLVCDVDLDLATGLLASRLTGS
jgi:predicted amidohydrolase